MDRAQASTVADVCDVLVREQLILPLSPEARRFVLEHETVSATDTAKLVDTFVRAQRTASVQPDASISDQLYSGPRATLEGLNSRSMPWRTCLIVFQTYHTAEVCTHAVHVCAHGKSCQSMMLESLGGLVGRLLRVLILVKVHKQK